MELHRLGLELAGAEAELDEGSPGAIDDGRWMKGWQFKLSGPIYAGTNEIQRNIVAERARAAQEVEGNERLDQRLQSDRDGAGSQ